MSGGMQALIVGAAGLGGLGVYLLMPRGSVVGRKVGIGLSLAGLALLWVIWLLNFSDVGAAARFVFLLLASLTVTSAVMTVTQRNPVSCALWFAIVVIGTAGLFLLLNAQFLAAATVIVYAGAIVVMFLFVVMMAQQIGTARHDRLSREPGWSVAASFVLLIALISTAVATYGGARPALADRYGEPPVSLTSHLDADPYSPQVAALGATLFTDHWLSLEVAGTLLLVAMVAAIVIAGQRKQA